MDKKTAKSLYEYKRLENMGNFIIIPVMLIVLIGLFLGGILFKIGLILLFMLFLIASIIGMYFSFIKKVPYSLTEKDKNNILVVTALTGGLAGATVSSAFSKIKLDQKTFEKKAKRWGFIFIGFGLFSIGMLLIAIFLF